MANTLSALNAFRDEIEFSELNNMPHSKINIPENVRNEEINRTIKVMNRNTNSICWSSQDFMNKTIEANKEIKIVNQASWKEAGLNHVAAALQIRFKDNSYTYFLNYYAVEIIENQLTNSWRVPSFEDWEAKSESSFVIDLKKELVGSISPFGVQENINFSTGYWTSDLQGERHAFAAILASINNKVYKKSFPFTEGYLLRLVEQSK